MDNFSDYGTGYILTDATRKKFEQQQAKAQRENDWFASNFPTIVVSESVSPNTVLAVNWKGVVDDMRRGESYTDAIAKNSASITGLL